MLKRLEAISKGTGELTALELTEAIGDLSAMTSQLAEKMDAAAGLDIGVKRDVSVFAVFPSIVEPPGN